MINIHDSQDEKSINFAGQYKKAAAKLKTHGIPLAAIDASHESNNSILLGASS